MTTKTTVDTRKIEQACKNLRNDCIEAKPLDMDWCERLGEDLDGWRSFEACACPDCGETVHGHGPTYEARHCDVDDESECEGYLTSEGPAMSYAYPLGHIGHSPEDAELLGGNVCLVEMDDGTWFLALTGGGMDLSWDICRAYIDLGYLPPVHFADLPEFAGAHWDEDHATVVIAMQRSLDIAGQWIKRRGERLIELVGRLKAEKE